MENTQNITIHEVREVKYLIYTLYQCYCAECINWKDDLKMNEAPGTEKKNEKTQKKCLKLTTEFPYLQNIQTFGKRLM